jgi:UDP-glucuronate 4-epimerase
VLAVTGGSGFIGLSLIEHLLQRGHSVLAHAMEPLPPMALAAFAAYPGQLSTVQGDIGDARLGQCLADNRVTHLFHGAAITAAQAREKVATRQILEVNQVCAYFNYSNRLLNGLGVTTQGDVIGYYKDGQTQAD